MQSDNSNSEQGGYLSDISMVHMIGEELKKPLTTIKALAELKDSKETISLEAKKALRTVDNILLYKTLLSDQTKLIKEPVHVGSTLTQVVNDLAPLSLERGCETEVFIQSNITTVDVDRKVLKSGIESMWQAVLGMTERPSTLTWYVQKTSKGIQITVMNNSIDLSRLHINADIKKVGKSRQPIIGAAGAGTDLYAANGLFDLLGSNLKKTKRDGLEGLSVTLPKSPQLSLI